MNCSKPACGRRGAWVLAYDYAESLVVLEERSPGELSPHLYLLCERCVDRFQPPRGWTVLDRRHLEEVPNVPEVEQQPVIVGETDYEQPLLFGESA